MSSLARPGPILLIVAGALATLLYVGYSVLWWQEARGFPDAHRARIEALRQEARLPNCNGQPWNGEGSRTFRTKLGECFRTARLEQEAVSVGNDAADGTLILLYGCDTPEFSANISFLMARVGGPARCSYDVAATCDALPPAFTRFDALRAPGDGPTVLARILFGLFPGPGDDAARDLVYDRNDCTSRTRAPSSR